MGGSWCDKSLFCWCHKSRQWHPEPNFTLYELYKVTAEWGKLEEVTLFIQISRRKIGKKTKKKFKAKSGPWSHLSKTHRDKLCCFSLLVIHQLMTVSVIPTYYSHVEETISFGIEYQIWKKLRYDNFTLKSSIPNQCTLCRMKLSMTNHFLRRCL